MTERTDTAFSRSTSGICFGTVAEHHGTMRAAGEHKGKSLAPLDLLIAAHALSAGAVLVTSDGAFRQVAGLRVEDWTTG